MKRFIVLFIVCAMLGGCATGYNFFCKPSANEQSAAQNSLDKANATLSILVTLPITPQVQAAIASIKLAIVVLKNVIAAICQTPEVIAQAQATVDTIQPVAMQMQTDYYKSMKR